MQGEAPELIVKQWLNTDAPIALDRQRGRVVILHAFRPEDLQCGRTGLPNIAIIDRNFSGPDVVVIGLCVGATPCSTPDVQVVQALIRDHRLGCAVALDMPSGSGPVPQTMKRFGITQTPCTIVIDGDGRIRGHQAGPVDVLSLGFLVGLLIVEPLVKKSASRRTATGATIDLVPVLINDETTWSAA